MEEDEPNSSNFYSFSPLFRSQSKILAVVLESQQLYLIDLRKRKRVLTKVSSSSNHAESSSQAQAKAQAGGLTEAEEEKEKTRGPTSTGSQRRKWKEGRMPSESR